MKHDSLAIQLGEIRQALEIIAEKDWGPNPPSLQQFPLLIERASEDKYTVDHLGTLYVSLERNGVKLRPFEQMTAEMFLDALTPLAIKTA